MFLILLDTNRLKIDPTQSELIRNIESEEIKTIFSIRDFQFEWLQIFFQFGSELLGLAHNEILSATCTRGNMKNYHLVHCKYLWN